MTDEAPNESSRGFPRRVRVTLPSEFDRVLKTGILVRDERLILRAARNALDHSRLGLIVSRRFGGAVQRNRAKRILREAFRLTRNALPSGFDFICTPAAGQPLRLVDAVQSLRALSEKAARRMASAPGR